MFETIIQLFEVWVKPVIEVGGYAGILGLMTLESACIPIPSEVIMPTGGILAQEGKLNFHLVALAGTLGCSVGSALAYWVGIVGGRPFIEKYGKYLLIRKKEIEHADAWFQKYGQVAVFFSRMLPIIRTFISLPAGIYRMKFWPFLILSFIGSLPWCYAMAAIGFAFQERREEISKYFHIFDYIIIVVVLFFGIRWIVIKRREQRNEPL